MNLINFCQRKVGGIRFLRLGRLTVSFCVSKKYKPLKGCVA